MLKLQFNLHHQDICLVNRGAIVATGSKNYLVAKFNQLTDDWETPLTAIFTDDKHQQPYAVIVGANSELEENECFVPWEVLTDECNVYVSVYCGNLHTTVTAAFKVRKSGYIDGETPPPPSPTVYTAIIQALQDLDSGKQDKLTAGEHISIESDGTIRGFEVAGWEIEAIDNCIKDGVLYSTSINNQAAYVLARNITTDITQYAFFRDGRVMWRTRQAETPWQPAGEWSEWEEISSKIASGVINQNGTISFYDADGNLLFTTTGTSVIGPQGPAGSNYVLTDADRQAIAQIAMDDAAAEAAVTGAAINSISLNRSSQSITLSTGSIIDEQSLITGLSIPYGTKIYVKLGFSASSNPVVTGKAVQIRANGKFIVSLNRGAVNNWTEVTLSGQLTSGEIITRLGVYLANDVLSTQTDFILSVRSSIIKSINDNADNISEINAVLQPLGETVNGHLLDYEILPTSNAPTFSGNTSHNDPLIVTLPYFYIRNKSAFGTAYTTRTPSNSPFSVGHNEGLFYNLETKNLEVLSVANTPLDTKYILLLWKQITAVKGLWAYIYYDSVLKQDVEGRLPASSGAVKTANLEDGAVTKDKLSEDLSAQIQQISSCKHYTKKIISRQGQGYGYPDNSLEGITAALKDGYRNIRLSVASTGDNVIYCTHSYELSHNTGYQTPVITQNGQPYTQNVVINDVTSEFIDSILYKGYAIPTLDEALKVISLYDADVTLEVKDDFSATAIQNIIDAIKFYSINITLSGLPQQVEPFANVYGGLNLGLIFNYSVNAAATYKARFEGKYKTVRFDCFFTDTITTTDIINNIHPDVKLKLGGSNITAAQAKEYMAYLDVTEYQGKVSDIY